MLIIYLIMAVAASLMVYHTIWMINDMWGE